MSEFGGGHSEVNNPEIKSPDVNETPSTETGGDASEATQDVVAEQANETGGFENDEEVEALEEADEEDGDLSQLEDESQSGGFDDMDGVEETGTESVIENTSDTYEKPGAADRFKDFIHGKESAYDAERAEKAGIKGAFDELPRDRREAVYETFENAPDSIKKTVNDLSDELSVEDTKGDDCCHYDLVDKKIRMEPEMDNAEYAEVFSHEYGHFVDNKKGDISNTPEFREAMSKDLANFDRNTVEGRENFDNMMDDLMSSDASYDRAVSDNLSAFFKNDPEIIQRYREEGAAYYQHSNTYWSRQGNCEAEIYANSFSMSAQDNKASCEFMEKYFPNTWEQFKSTL